MPRPPPRRPSVGARLPRKKTRPESLIALARQISDMEKNMIRAAFAGTKMKRRTEMHPKEKLDLFMHTDRKALSKAHSSIRRAMTFEERLALFDPKTILQEAKEKAAMESDHRKIVTVKEILYHRLLELKRLQHP